MRRQSRMGPAFGLAMLLGFTPSASSALADDQVRDDIEAGVREFEAAKRQEIENALDEVTQALKSQERELAALQERVAKTRAGLSRLQALRLAFSAPAPAAPLPALPTAPTPSPEPVARVNNMPPLPSRSLPIPLEAPADAGLASIPLPSPSNISGIPTPSAQALEPSPLPSPNVTLAEAPSAPASQPISIDALPNGRLRVTTYQRLNDHAIERVQLECSTLVLHSSTLAPSPTPNSPSAPAPCCSAPPEAAGSTPSDASLAAKVRHLEEQIAQLRAELDSLRGTQATAPAPPPPSIRR